jgi:trypsin
VPRLVSRLALLGALLTLAAAPAAAAAPPPKDPRVVNGSDAGGPFPHQVALVQKEADGSIKHPFFVFCGGTIRDDTHVVTAAHCVPDSNAGDFVVVAGMYRQDDSPQQLQIKGVSAVTSHLQYDDASKANDLAVLTLASPLQFGQGVGPLPVATGGPEVDTVNLISGWGTTQSGGQSPDRLLYALVLGYANEKCSGYGQGFIAAVMLCAGYTDQQQGLTYDTCQGDSGGPLARWAGDLNQNQQYDLAEFNALLGVVSFGRGCADPQYPGIYTRLLEPGLNQMARNPNPPKRMDATAPPAVQGTVETGQTLSCAGDAWDPAPSSRSVQWLSAAIGQDNKPTDVKPEGNAATLALGSGHLNRIVTCVVRVENPGGHRSIQAKIVGPVKQGASPGPGPGPGPNPGPGPGPGPGGTLPGGTTPGGTTPGGTGPGGTTPPADLVPPVTALTRRSCAGRVCSLTITGSDSGGPATRAVVRMQRISGCKKGRRGASCRKTRTLTAKRVGEGIFQVRTARLAPAKYRFTVTTIDASGNQGKAVAAVLTVRRR